MSGGVKNPELKLETKESLEEQFGEDLINKQLQQSRKDFR